MNSNRTWLAAAMVAAIGLHFVPFTMYLSPDLHQAYRPWYYHLLEKGFSEPISNYSPPYLYLLWGLTRFDGIFWPNVMSERPSMNGLMPARIKGPPRLYSLKTGLPLISAGTWA